MRQRLTQGGLAIAVTVLLAACSGGSDGGGTIVDPADLGGTIAIESGTRVDVDTADDSRAGVAGNNDLATSAQILPDTGILGGYASLAGGQYSDGPGGGSFEYFADGEDFFRVGLMNDDRIALQVFPEGEGAVPFVRLSVVRDDTGAEQCNSGCSGTESSFVHVISGASGSTAHTVSVRAEDGGPFRYVLSITTSSGTSSMVSGYGGADFVVGEAVVKPDTSGQAFGSSAAIAQAMNAAEARPLGLGLWHVRQAPTYLTRQLSGSERLAAQMETLDWIRSLRNQPGVELVEPNYLYEAQQVTPETNRLYDLQWNIPLIELPSAWLAAPNAGSGVGIAVLDTGLFSTTPNTYGSWHEDLVQNVTPALGSQDWVSAEFDIDGTNGRDDNPHDPGDLTGQSSFHGTHVAGIASAVDNTIGIVGVAPNSVSIPVRVLGVDKTSGRTVGSLDDLIAGINWASTQPEIHVINLSLGGVGDSQTLEMAINNAYNNGKLVVAAAGNQGTDQPTFPAAFENVVGVGAVDAGEVRAGYSNVGVSVSLVAPGGDANRDANQDGNADLIISAWGDDSNGLRANYAGLQGTSMAAPHVAGVYALMKEAAASSSTPRNLTPQDFRALLENGQLTDDLGDSFQYGRGLINALKSVDAALDGNIPTVLGADPSALQFTESLSSQTVTLTVFPEGDTVSVSNVTPPPWLQIDPALEREVVAGSTSFTASVTDAGLMMEDNLYRGEIEITYGAQNRVLEIPVSLQLGELAEDRNAGRHFVLLVSTDENRDTVQQEVVEAVSGQYTFAFDEVEPGDYFLVAGTDMDNNGFICENGEACAEYPVNGLPEPITIGDSPISGVRLTTSFRRPTITEMGLPRVGFEGYRLLGDDNTDEPVRRVEGALP
ncbi:MAG: S8 family serine peptidase [Marinobacter sp.]|uniref:S8 family serine peptidase n=1 Tax=Marinobacter sp. TaxID=50741 RepID=UPI00299D2933|nr:S8 family serine peptidase [Marinobacter sp.]MDX1635262.1 S8 family serine peptidase [Marinobacter sp.]